MIYNGDVDKAVTKRQHVSLIHSDSEHQGQTSRHTTDDVNYTNIPQNEIWKKEEDTNSKSSYSNLWLGQKKIIAKLIWVFLNQQY